MYHFHLGRRVSQEDSVGLPSGLFPSAFLINNLYPFLFALIRATCPAHPILLFIILIILGEEYKS
jgi:hypothetical protein